MIIAQAPTSVKRLSALAQLVRMLRRDGITTTSALVSETGYSERAIWAAKRELSSREMVQPSAPADGAAECTRRVQPAAVEVQPSAPCTLQSAAPSQKKGSPHTPLKENILPTKLSIGSKPREAAEALDGASRLIDLDALDRRLRDAAGPVLDNPVNSSGLLSLSVPLGWLRAGADLELDVVPALRSVAARGSRLRVRDWSYFGRAVAEAVQRRAAGLPSVEAAAAPKRTVRQALADYVAAQAAGGAA